MHERLRAAAVMAAAMCVFSVAHTQDIAPLGAGQLAAPAQTRTISFSGHNWTVKTSSGKVGPGPNYFSNSTSNVWVDTAGRLHMRIARQKGHWYCAEIVAAESFGYGTYRFYLDSPVDNLDPNVVLGLFTWNDDPAYNHREIDIEFSRWASAANQNAQYVVQPYTIPANIFRFNEPVGLAQSTHSFHWLSGSVEFDSIKGWYAAPPDQTFIIQQRTMTGGAPVAGGEHARINLWLFQGNAPTNGREVEVIVNRFEFVAG
jgi:hypothetical protein